MYTDLTGAFLVQLFCNMQYVLVAYIYDLNAILLRTIPSKNDGDMITAFISILASLCARGYVPTLSVMNDECSKAVEAHINSFTTMGAHMHQRY
jgi:hypothetical protein